MRRSLLMAIALAATTLLAACNTGASELTGKTGQLQAITEQVPAFQGVVPVEDQQRYTITFNTGGTFSATADCNQVAGSYTTGANSKLTITPGPSTLAFCGEGSFGDLFVHALSQAASYKVDGESLTITLGDGGTLTFGAASASASAPAAVATTAAPTD